MKNGILLFLLTSLLFLSLTGNANQADTYGRDTANINTWINKCSELIYLSPDSIPVYADSILHIAQDINYNLGLYKGNNYLGISSWMMGKYDDALIYYHKALEYAFLTKDKRNPAVVLSNIALIYNSSYNKDSAKYYLNKSIAYSKENGVYDIYYKSLFDLSNLHLNHDEYIDGYMNLVLASQRPDIEEDSLLLMNIYASFGILYSKVNKFDSSYYYYKKAVKVDSAVEEFDNISNTLINIGHLFFHVKRDPDSARHFYGQALLLAPNYNKKDIELVVNINIANIFLESKELDSAFYYYDKVLNNPLLKTRPNIHAAVNVNLGMYYLKKDRLPEARDFLNRGLNLSDSLNIINFKMIAFKNLATLDSTMGNFKQSLEFYKAYSLLSDSIDDTDAKNKLATLEFEKHLAQSKFKNQVLLNEIKTNNSLIFRQKVIITLSFLITITLLIFIYFQHKNRKKRKALLQNIEGKNIELTVLNQELNKSNDLLSKNKEELKQLNLSKDKFISIMGHDLKSPYNGMLGLLQVMEHDWELITDEEKKNYLLSFHKLVENNYKLLEDLLSWGKAQQGILKKKPGNINVNNVTNNVLNLFKTDIASKEITTEIIVSKEINIITDPYYFKQILHNLIHNAIKFSNKGGNVKIITNTNKNLLQYCILDNGIGIPENEIGTIFNLDNDFKRPGTNQEKSTGMGLILSKEYANIIGANITVESKEEDREKGQTGWTRFCITINIKDS